MKKKNTLQSRLFKNYSFIMSLILILCFIILSFFYIHNEYRRMIDYLNTLASSIANNIEQETDKLSNASMNTIYSKSLKSCMDNIDPQAPDWNLITEVNKVIGSIIGPYSTVSQINVYSIHNYMVGWGTFSISQPAVLTQQPWYKEVNALHGYKYIGLPSMNEEFTKINPYMKSRYYLSMYRMYYDSAYQPQGVVEVVQDCSIFFSYLDELCEDNPELSVQIINSGGDLIYPYKSHTSTPGYYKSVQEGTVYQDTGNIVYDENGNRLFLTWKGEEKSGWNILITQNTRYLFEKLYPFLLVFTGFLAAFLCASMYLCFHVAKNLMLPLNSLKTQLEKINLDEILSSDTSLLIDSQENTTAEIETLFEIYNDMYLSLKDSSESIINAKAEEARAKLFATQSMLKPHFLYNNLTNISIMAENNMTPQIITFCSNLCRYLRYISSDGLANVDIATELKYSVSYLDCMKIRYGDKLHYQLDIPDELKKIQIPKLTLQPLIENSLKYAFPNSPPWIIRIAAAMEDQFCCLSVSDNGIGFSDESLGTLIKQLDEIRHSKDIYSIEIGGLGIRNVFLRLLFMYGEKADLLITGSQNAGAKIVIKIPIGK